MGEKNRKEVGGKAPSKLPPISMQSMYPSGVSAFVSGVSGVMPTSWSHGWQVVAPSNLGVGDCVSHKTARPLMFFESIQRNWIGDKAKRGATRTRLNSRAEATMQDVGGLIVPMWKMGNTVPYGT